MQTRQVKHLIRASVIAGGILATTTFGLACLRRQIRRSELGFDAFEAGLDEFQAGKFSNSADLMNRACQLRGGSDGPAQFYLRRIAILQGQDLKNWDGIIELSEK